MGYISVRTDPHRGVYAFTTQKERAELARLYDGTSMRVFDDKKEAEKWAQMKKTEEDKSTRKRDDYGIFEAANEAGYLAVKIKYRPNEAYKNAEEVALILKDAISVVGGLPYLEVGRDNEVRVQRGFYTQQSMSYRDYVAFAEKMEITIPELFAAIGAFLKKRGEKITLKKWRESGVCYSSHMLFAQAPYLDLDKKHMEITGDSLTAKILIWDKIEEIEPYMEDHTDIVALIKEHCLYEEI